MDYYWLFGLSALAAVTSPLGVIAGALAGHAVATMVYLKFKKCKLFVLHGVFVKIFS